MLYALAPVGMFHFSDEFRYLGDTGSGTCVPLGIRAFRI